MYDERHAFNTVAASIIEWQAVAQQLPMDDLCEMAMTCQRDLAASLNTFNGICQIHDEGSAPSAEAMRAMGEVTRVATAMAILSLGIAFRVHQAVSQN